MSIDHCQNCNTTYDIDDIEHECVEKCKCRVDHTCDKHYRELLKSHGWRIKKGLLNKFLDSPVNSIGLKLGDMILHNGEIIRDIPEVIDALNSVLEQERKDEHDKIITDIQSGKIKIPSLTIQQEVEVPVDIADHIRKDEHEKVVRKLFEASKETLFYSIVQQEARKDERQRVLSEVIEGLKTTETHTERDEQIVQNIITKLNQLKEE